MAFELTDFIVNFEQNPAIELINNLKKTELLQVCQHYDVAVKTATKKAEIKQTLVESLVKGNVLSEMSLETIVTPSGEIGLKMMRLEYELKQKELESRMRELETQLKMKDYEQELERMRNARSVQPTTREFDVSKHIRLVPPFNEKDIENYFLHFEKVAEKCKWPHEVWTLLLQSVLSGKAQRAYVALSCEESSDYDEVKQAILRAYELVPEAYRQKFRNVRKQEGQTFVEFAREKEILFDRWYISKKVDSFDQLKQLMLLEEFKRCVPGDIRSHLAERDISDLQMASKIADNYALTHKGSFNKDVTHNVGFKKRSNQLDEMCPQDDTNATKHHSDQNSKAVSGKDDRSAAAKKTCTYCKKIGHLKSECWFLERKNVAVKSVAHVALASEKRNVIQGNKIPNVKVTSITVQNDVVDAVFKPFVSEGYVIIDGEKGKSSPIKILRDTGAAQSLILESALPASESTATGTSVLLEGVGGFMNVPLHRIQLKSDFVSGSVVVGVKSTLPVEGISLLLGNDLAGGKVTADPCMSEHPSMQEDMVMLEEEFPVLFPVCVTTRAMKHKVSREIWDADEYDLESSFLGNGEIGLLGKPPMDQADKTIMKDCVKPALGREQLISEQGKDPELSLLSETAMSEDEADDVAVCYFKKNGVLMRKWRPIDVPMDQEWSCVYQVVIPPIYRQDILSLAHEGPMAGHLGVRKTCDRIMRHFYWPKVRSDVSEFCKTCHTCQVVGKPNQKIPKAPLRPVPAFEEPFSRVIVDCVGPLPKSKGGNEYMLTIMCASTRFPEAVPLRKISAKSIVKALIKFFTLVGIPKSIQTDQGSNFMSGIFKKVMSELGVAQYQSSAYHPESQGALERFHQTLKTMLRAYCFENGKNWDEGVPLVLFAVREVVQESLGFSPFELVFGHSVRGPLKLMKEKWLAEESETNMLDYVSDFKQRLTDACNMAKAHLKETQKEMKTRYDEKTKVRKFNPGDQVLVLLPITGQPLQAKYHGPYVIHQRVSDLNYVVNTPDRRKQRQMCHVNMLKEYHVRETCDKVPVSVNVRVDTESAQDDCFEVKGYGCTVKLQNSVEMSKLEEKLCHLTPSQQQELTGVIHEYSPLFQDTPSKTDVITHDVDVGDARPIKQHAYRVNPIKREVLRAEVKYMLQNEIIECSHSEWSSPCLLVPKADQTYRFCTDYRRVNTVTKTDAFPIPRMEDCIDKIGNAKYVSKFDLLKGYWQVPLTKRSVEISAFVTPDGLYQYKVMPFGMKNSSATFQRLMNSIIMELEGCDVYIDDLIIYSDTWEEHILRIRALFKKLREARLTINLGKSEFGKGQVTYLGHVVGQGQVSPINAKVEKIANFPNPQSKRELMRYLGMAGYYRKFCLNFSEVVAPMTNLLKKNVKFEWSSVCQKAFDKVKAILCTSPVLVTPDFEKRFVLTTDASDVGAGSVLQQESASGLLHPVCYFSKKFNKHQKNYSTIEKEALSLILALNHFDVYLCTTIVPVQVFTDHNPLIFINRMKNTNQRVMRWSLMLQEYSLDIHHIRGKDNVIADTLSRIV